MTHHQSDGAGRAEAVEAQIIEVAVAVAFDVHGYPREQLGWIVDRDLSVADDLLERGRDQPARTLAGVDRVETEGKPSGQGGRTEQHSTGTAVPES